MITRGTTPTIRYTFNIVNVSDIATAYLTLSADNSVILEKTLESAVINENALEWQLTQEETLLLKSLKEISIQLRYKTTSGDAYATPITTEKAGRILKDGVI